MVGILGPEILSPQGTSQSSAWRDPSLKWIALSAVGLSKLKPLNFERYQEKTFAKAAEVDCVSGCAMMIRRDLLDELGGFDKDYFMYFEESDFCVRARRRVDLPRFFGPRVSAELPPLDQGLGLGEWRWLR